MQRSTTVIVTTLGLLLATAGFAAPQSGGGSSSSSPGLAEQVEEIQEELDELQLFALNATSDISTTRTLSSNVDKKLDDTINGTIDKIRALEQDDDDQDGVIGALGGRLGVLEAMVASEIAAPPRQGHFLDIEGIEGESTDAGHPEEIEVLSWSWGATQQGGSSSGSGAAAGKVNMTDISITKRIDRSSPTLFMRCANGTHIPEAVITVRSANRTDYLVITLENVLVTSYQTGGSSQDVTEQVSFRYEAITMEYVPLQPDGTPGAPVSAGWNVATNSAT